MALTVGQVRYQTPDGGYVSTKKAPNLVPIGDGGWVFDQIVYRRDGVEAVFEVWDGRPVCTSITVSGNAEDRVPVQRKDLDEIQIDNLCEDAYAATGVFQRQPDGGWVHGRNRSAFSSERRKVRAARKKVNEDFLQRVARVHAAAAGARVKAVVDEFGGVSERTAKRYIAEAREAGLIPPSRRSSELLKEVK